MQMYPESDGSSVFHSVLIEVFFIHKKINKPNDNEKPRDLYNEVSPLATVKTKF